MQIDKNLYEETPIFYAHVLSKKLDKDIYFKMDCHQPIGSFKIRGVGRLCEQMAYRGSKHFVIASGGNAGLAVAYSGWKLNIPTTVVVPTTTKPMMRDKLASYGAKVKVFGDVWDDANVYAQSLVLKEKATYIPPFDHPTIWFGNATVIDECDFQLAQEPDIVVVAVGGGGYFCGVMEGVERNNWRNTLVVAAETEGAASLDAAIRAKKLVTLDKITSIASSLGAKTVAQQALDWALQEEFPVRNYTVTDQQAVEACYQFLNDTGSLVEPACGAALASVYHNLDIIKDARSVLVLVCGGAGATLDMFNAFKK